MINETLTNYTDAIDRRHIVYIIPDIGSLKKCYGTYIMTRSAGTFNYLFGDSTFIDESLQVINTSCSYSDQLRFENAKSLGMTKIVTDLVIEYTK